MVKIYQNKVEEKKLDCYNFYYAVEVHTALEWEALLFSGKLVYILDYKISNFATECNSVFTSLDTMEGIQSSIS